MSWKLTLQCTRAEAEALGGDTIVELDPLPVITVTEPDPAKPDDWRMDAYFEREPSSDAVARLRALIPSARRTRSEISQVAEQDWVTLSQSGFEPLIAGRFRVRTPEHAPRDDRFDLVIPAGLAFGTGQHATTAGCLTALDALKRRGRRYRTILDLGTGTGLLAFAAKRLWPNALVIASDIDPISVRVVAENAALNRVRGLRLAVADGIDHRELIAHRPYDLIIANILAAPLIEMADEIAQALAPGATLLLAGLLDTQAERVARAYRRGGLRLAETVTPGEWPTLRMIKKRRG